MKVGIDMGHCLTGVDTSANGVFSESQYNRIVGKKVIELLKSKGHEVINCTIDYGCSDITDSLRKRVDIANSNNVDVFCSIHFNSGGGKGTEVYLANRSAFVSEDSYNKNLTIAKRVNDKIVASCNFSNRGVKHEDFYVIYNTKALAILVEVCFCDSQEDFNKLSCDKVAMAIVEGLTNEVYNVQSKPVENKVEKEYVKLKYTNQWRIYPEGVAIVKGNEKGILNPRDYGENGILTYEILGRLEENAVIIKTRDYGRGVVYLPPGDNEWEVVKM